MDLSTKDIAFTEYKKQDIHGTVLYPATMVAPVQKSILAEILMQDDIKTVFDPFHGSGTALYEAFELNPSLSLLGCDINPLANLITRVKLTGISNRIKSDITRMELLIKENMQLKAPFTFPRIEKWFRSDIIQSLSAIRFSIKQIKNKRNRLYFWYIFCDSIRKYSNTRSSTYKLHIKTQNSIDNINNNVVDEFIKRANASTCFFTKRNAKAKLFKKDVLSVIRGLKNDSVDLAITSPPYGDNATTVTYGEFSWLALQWIDHKDLVLEGWELENTCRIDAKSLGGSRAGKQTQLSASQLELFSYELSQIDKSKQAKVIYFFSDYFAFLDELCRVTGKYVILTLGNRTVDGIRINLTEITRKYLEKHKYQHIQTLQRSILNKRIPLSTSNVRGKAVSSMNKEYVLIAKKAP